MLYVVTSLAVHFIYTVYISKCSSVFCMPILVLLLVLVPSFGPEMVPNVGLEGLG